MKQGDADDEGDIRKLVDEGLSEIRFATELTESVADFVAEAVEAEAAVIVKLRLEESTARGDDPARPDDATDTKFESTQTKGQPDA